MKNIGIILILYLFVGCSSDLKPEEPLTINGSSNLKELSNFKDKWYLKELKTLKEPSLVEFEQIEGDAYRFLWFRSFHHPISVRIELDENGGGTLFLKVGEDGIGTAAGELIINEQTNLTESQVYMLKNELIN